jgi:hypothetical protein
MSSERGIPEGHPSEMTSFFRRKGLKRHGDKGVSKQMAPKAKVLENCCAHSGVVWPFSQYVREWWNGAASSSVLLPNAVFVDFLRGLPAVVAERFGPKVSCPGCQMAQLSLWIERGGRSRHAELSACSLCDNQVDVSLTNEMISRT